MSDGRGVGVAIWNPLLDSSNLKRARQVAFGRFIFTRKSPEKPGEYEIRKGDAIEETKKLSNESIDLVLTSPPYTAKFDYGCGQGEHGSENSLNEFLEYEFALAKALLPKVKPNGNLFIVIGDSRQGSGGPGGDFKHNGQYCARRGAKEKHILPTAQLMVPERLRLMYTAAGWMPLQCIVWNKNDARRAAQGRFSDSHEKILHFIKQPDHYFDRSAVLMPRSDKSETQLRVPYSGRRMIKSMKERDGVLLRDVITLSSGFQPRVWLRSRKTGKRKLIRGLACFPLTLAEIIVNVASPSGGFVYDPFAGMGTTLLAASLWGRNSLGIEFGSTWVRAAKIRIKRALKNEK